MLNNAEEIVSHPAFDAAASKEEYVTNDSSYSVEKVDPGSVQEGQEDSIIPAVFTNTCGASVTDWLRRNRHPALLRPGPPGNPHRGLKFVMLILS